MQFKLQFTPVVAKLHEQFFVEAATPAEAIEKAIAKVRAELTMSDFWIWDGDYWDAQPPEPETPDV